MATLTPAPRFSPRAFRRAALTPLLAVLLAPANRARLASFAHRAGLLHVSVSLTEIAELRTRPPTSASADADVSGDASASESPPDQKSAASHATAKLPASASVQYEPLDSPPEPEAPAGGRE